MALSVKHRIFVREYLKDKNATRAYKASGHEGKGATQSASKLLTNPNVKLAVEKGLARLEAKIELSAERVLASLAEIAFVPLTVKELKNQSHNKLRALELLAKHFKLLTDVQELGGKDGGPLVVLTMPANGSEAASTPVNEPTSVDADGGN